MRAAAFRSKAKVISALMAALVLLILVFQNCSKFEVNGDDGAVALSSTSVLGHACAPVNPSPITMNPAYLDQMSAGWSSSCQIESGHVKCWGDNRNGILGNFSDKASLTPVDVSCLDHAVSVAVGNDIACALISNGDPICWGGARTSADLTGLHGVVSIALSTSVLCAVLSNGHVMCSGSNSYGALGNGTQVSSLTPVEVSGVNDAVSVSTTGDSVCALLKSGGVKCWGSGVLGNGSTGLSTVPVEVTGIENAVSVAVAWQSACAVLATGAVKCWGSNHDGGLGNGGTQNTNALVPALVSGLGPAKRMKSARYSPCALLADGTVRCWGRLSWVFDPSFTQIALTPVDAGLTGVSDLSSAVSNSQCAILSSGSYRCWGDNFNGQLGTGTRTGYSTLPVTVAGAENPKDLSLSSDAACVVKQDGTVACWGFGIYSSVQSSSYLLNGAPLTVSGLANASQVATGFNSNSGSAIYCALLATGNVTCWGAGGSRLMPGLSNAVDVKTQVQYACALLADGTVQCWGRDISGRLGRGATSSSTDPMPVTGLTDAVALSIGYAHGCALLRDHTVKCWGAKLGTSENNLLPYTVDGFAGALQISAAEGVTCAVMATGKIKCLGSNSLGQLGNPAVGLAGTSEPVEVVGLTDAVQVSASDLTTCARTKSGAVYCWGQNTGGVTGTAPGSNASTPQAIPGITNAVRIEAGSDTACAVLATGETKCWGRNTYGRLGFNPCCSVP